MSIHQASGHRKARMCALQMLYQWEIGKELPEDVQRIYWSEVREQTPRKLADQLFEAATKEAGEIDTLIGKHARRWSVKRLPTVDRNLLRLAITEFRHRPKTPPALIIEETLEIAKLFSGEGSIKFLNGVLDSVLKDKGDVHE